MPEFKLPIAGRIDLSITMGKDETYISVTIEPAEVPEAITGELVSTDVGEFSELFDRAASEYVERIETAVKTAQSATAAFVPPKPPMPAAQPSDHRVDKFGNPIVSPASHVSAAEWLVENGKLRGFGADMKRKITLSVGQHAGHIARAEGIEPKWTGSQPGRGDRLYPREVWAGAHERTVLKIREENRAK